MSAGADSIALDDLEGRPRTVVVTGASSGIGKAAATALANILFTRALAKRLAPDGIVAHAMHPRVVDSNFVSHADESMQRCMATLKDVSVTPAAAADTLAWLATAPEPGRATGGYYHQRAAVPTSAAAQDDAATDRLWREREAIVARIVPF